MTGPVCLHDDCEDNDVDGVLLCFQSGMGMMGAQQGMMPPTYQQAMVSTRLTATQGSYVCILIQISLQ